MNSSSSILSIFCCVLIYGKFCCLEAFVMPNSYYELDGSTDSECTLRDLKTERNLEFDFPMSKETPKCRLTWSQLNEAVREEMKLFIAKHAPSDGNCLSDRFVKSDKTLDLVLTITAIQAGDFFSATEKKVRLVNFQNDLKNNLEEIANECKYPKDKFLELFQGAFMNNETLIAMESTYCLAKYVTDNEVLTLRDVNLNPHNINTDNLNCSIVIEEERRKDEERFRDNMTLRDQTAIACVMNVYTENEVFYLDFAEMVLDKSEISEEMKRSEKDKINLKRAILSFPFKSCYDMDKDYPYA